MKLLCCGDFHLGAGAEYGPRPGDRLRDQHAVLEQIFALAIDENVDAVLFAGDAFERRTPTPSELMVWRDFVTTLREEHIAILGIAGNHDVANAGLPTGMEVLGSCGRSPEVVDLADEASLATLPWTPPARLVAARGGGDRDELHAEAAQLLLESARDLRTQIPEGRTSILLAHWSISGAALPSGLPVAQLREPVLPGTDLEELGFDFVIAGHIHRAQLLGSENAHGPMLYVGSPMTLNFGEANVEHGVWIVDTEHTYETGNPVSYRFVPIEDRPFVTVDVDLTLPEAQVPRPIGDLTDETDEIASAIGAHFPLTDAVVRIRYKATAEQARRVDHAALRGLVADAGASKLYAIQPEIVRSERARVAGVDEQVEPLAAVELWIENQGIESPGPLRSLTSRYLEEAAA